MLGLDVSSEVGGRSGSISAVLAQEPLTKMQRPVAVQLAWVGERLVADVTSKVLSSFMRHEVILIILSFHEPNKI